MRKQQNKQHIYNVIKFVYGFVMQIKRHKLIVLKHFELMNNPFRLNAS